MSKKISKYFLEELNLTLNPNKTMYEIFQNQNQINKYLEANSKKVSSKNNNNDNYKKPIFVMFNEFVNTLNKFSYNSENQFNYTVNENDREVLKYVFNKSFVHYLCKEENVKKINDIISNIDLELTIDSIYIMIILFFVKNKNKKIFFKNFKNNYNKSLNVFDKRAIHIAMLCYTQDFDLSGIKNQIRRSLNDLEKDNYGKYLVTLSNYYKDKDSSYLDKSSIYHYISFRYKKNTAIPIRNKKDNYRYNIIYNSLINNEEIINEAQIQQLKDFVYYYGNCEWNLAYNSFYNLFHEICKVRFKRNDNNYNINNMIDDLYKNNMIDQNDNLLLIKFADSRNFNSISHPSKNGIKSIKVSRDKLDFYINEIGNIILKML